jgi:hypothetical protein
MTELPTEIRDAMSPGEQALWWGRPRQGLVLRGSDVFLIPFSVLWCGFAIFWEAGVVGSDRAPGFFVLWGIPFVLVGVYMVIGRFFVEAWQRSRTRYALTPERVLIVSGIFARSVKSLPLDTLTDLTLIESRGRQGSITFGPQNPFASMFGGASSWPGSRQQQSPRFDLIDDAKGVYERINSARRARK